MCPASPLADAAWAIVKPSRRSVRSCPIAARQSMRTLAEMGARLPYRRARALLDDLFPLGTPPVVETLRQRTLQVGARLECQAATSSRPTPEVAVAACNYRRPGPISSTDSGSHSVR